MTPPECVIVPYDVIRLNDGDQLTHLFTKLFGQLEVDKQEFIKYTLSNYHASYCDYLVILIIPL